MTILAAVVLSASLFSRGDSLLKVGNYNEAIPVLQRCLTEEPGNYSARLDLAKAYAYAGQRSDAIELLTKMLIVYPKDVDVRIFRGRVYAWDKKYDEAVADLNQVLIAVPTYDEAHSTLIDAYLWSGKLLIADSIAKDWCQFEPNSPEPFLNQAKVKRELQDYMSARKSLALARQKHGNAEDITELEKSLNAVPVVRNWEISTHYLRQTYTAKTMSDWEETEVGVMHKFSGSSAKIYYTAGNRYSISDHFYGVDCYVDLMPKTYGNLIIQKSNQPKYYPNLDYLGEVYRYVGLGFETSIGFRRMEFSTVDVNFYSVSMGNYAGALYLKYKLMLVDTKDSRGFVHFGVIRRYLSGEDNYLELDANLSRSNFSNPSDPSTSTAHGYAITIGGQQFVYSVFGFTYSVTYAEDFHVPVRRDGAIGLIYRW